MANRIDTTDWTLIQSFLCVAETGSLSAAARKLGRSQPTLGRQIQALEHNYGSTLFDRHTRGLRLSETGAKLLPMAEQMRDAMNALSLTAAGEASALNGTVRITASLYASHYVLPSILADIRQKEPQIDIVLIPNDLAENLLFRVADIAVRMYRPTQLDIVARHVGDLKMGIFAAKSYLDRVGRPKCIEEIFDHDVVGFDQNDLILRTMRQMGWSATPEDFAIRCDQQATYWELVRAGCGIGFSQTHVAQADPAIEELDFGLSIPPLPMWLAAHKAMRHTPRIRRVWDLLMDGLTVHASGR